MAEAFPGSRVAPPQGARTHQLENVPSTQIARPAATLSGTAYTACSATDFADPAEAQSRLRNHRAVATTTNDAHHAQPCGLEDSLGGRAGAQSLFLSQRATATHAKEVENAQYAGP